MRSLLPTLVLVALVFAADAPPEVVRLNEQGLAQLASRKPAGAVQAFEAALRKLPDNLILRRNLAAALAAEAERKRAAHKPAEAARLLDRAIDLHPERLRYRVLRGRARFEAHEGQYLLAALEDFEHVLERDRDHLDALVNAGQIRYLERRLQGAVDYWSRALALRPTDEDVRARLAKAERELAVEATYHEIRGSGFVVRYSPKIPRDVAEGVLALFEQSDSELTNRFEVHPREATRVTLYAPSEFRSATGVHGWVAGLSDGTVRLTVRPTDRPSRLRPTIYHEYTHHLLRSYAPRTPVWLHEGLAQIAEGRSREAAEARLRAAGGELSTNALSARIIALRDPRVVGRLYDLALSFTHYLYDLSGERGMKDLLRLIRERKSEEEAFRTVYGHSRDAVFADWQRKLRQR